MIYCIDDRHGTPCPADCPPCRDECDPAATIEAATPIEAARAASWSEEYIADQIARGLLAP